jgi:hypothetical protein
VTPLGTKKLSSTTMADGKGNLSEIDSRNIIMVKLEELPEESQKKVEEFQRRRRCKPSSHASRRTGKVG